MADIDQAKFFGIQQKYEEEKLKRLREDGLSQFVPLAAAGDERVRALSEDPWADHAALNAKKPAVKNGGKYKYVILGAGYGAQIIAVHLIESGVAKGPDDIRMVDTAGGFGGTWYWNRYPGLHCDVESYIYMPLLEQTGYMPKNKYSDGPELLEHADRIAKQWNLHDKALFRASVKSARWDEATQLWDIDITEGRGPDEESRNLTAHAQYFIVASGVLSTPQVPKIPGLENFSGPLFHTARWNYSVTGGNPNDPALTGLEGKRVGVIGTGATAIQMIPKVAKWAKELYVFQRTPSAVDTRGQRPTDPEEWKSKIATKKGWQRERMLNFDSYLTDAAKDGQENLVGDGWTQMPSYSGLIGSPRYPIVEPTPEKIGEHIMRLLALDVERSERVRERTKKIVKDPETAAKLQAWYPGWCKRPTFNDEYLQAYNLPHVNLVDTDGKGVASATNTGLVVAGKEYPLDVLILSTGFRSPAIGDGSPPARSGIEVYGRDGLSLEDKWKSKGASTLHGITSNGFPNLFFTTVAQFGQAANNVLTLEVVAEQLAHIVARAEEKAGDGKRAIVEATVEAEEAWAMEFMMRAAWYATISVCTPSYMTSEGEAQRLVEDPAAMAKRSRAAGWSQGMESFINVLAAYRAEGSLKGYDVKTVDV
ncbi:Pentalenolactone D synthase [Cladorrhinum sp. PSN259]|nr:Pentalenolactone D synthase [Cladorrhinum sp. PSN259]